MRFVLLTLVVVAMLYVPHGVVAQDTEEPEWTPSDKTLVVGAHRFIGDGMSSWRAGIAWYFSPQLRTTVTGRLWDGYDVVEADMRWIRDSEGQIRPFAATSALWERIPGRQGLGASVGGGIEFYLLDETVLDFGLVWESVFRDSGASDSHWFRLNAGASVVPFFWNRRR